MSALDDALNSAAIGPKSVQTDAGMVVSKDVDQIIAADQYRAAKAGLSKAHRGLRFSKFIKGGQTGDSTSEGTV